MSDIQPKAIAVDAKHLEQIMIDQGGLAIYNGRADRTFGMCRDDMTGEWLYWQDYGGEDETFATFDEMMERMNLTFPYEVWY